MTAGGIAPYCLLMYRDIELLVTFGIGTVGHDEHPPANIGCGEIGAPGQSVTPASYRLASVKNAPDSSIISGCTAETYDNRTGALNPFPVKQTLRAQRLRDMLAAVEEWRRASGPDRAWWRQDALWRLQEWRRLYRIPQRAAFQDAVSSAAQRRAAA